MQCQHCGTNNKDTAKFCLSCGTHLAALPVDTTDCPECAHPNKAHAKFCAQCGARLQPVAPAGEAPGAAVPDAPVPPMPPAPNPGPERTDALHEAPTTQEPPRAGPASEPAPAPLPEPGPTPAPLAEPAAVPTGKAGKPRAAIIGIAAAIAVLGASGAWWLSRADKAPQAVPVAAEPAQAAEPAAAARPEPPAAAAAQPPQAPAEAAAAATPMPAQPPVQAAAKPSAEESEARKAAQLARRKAAEEARKKKLDEENALAEARSRQPAAPQPVRNDPPAPAAPKALTTGERVAQCQTANPFKREICLWQVCNSKWGQDGCPNYKSGNTQDNY